MSDAILVTGSDLGAPLSDWSRERPFQIAVALSVAAHAILIAFVPGFRSVPPDAPPVLEVQIVPAQVTPVPRIKETPVVIPKIITPQRVEPPPEPRIVEPRPRIVPEPARPSEPEVKIQPTPAPVPQVQQPEPVAPPRPDVIALPRAEPRPELAAPRIQPPSESKPLPKADVIPEPQIERAPPPPVARLEPRPQPPTKPAIEPLPQPPQIEPKIVRQEAKLQQELPRPVVPRAEPSPPDARSAPPLVNSAPIPPVASAPTPPAASAPPAAAKPQPAAPKANEEAEGRLLLTFSQSISKQIKRYQKYPAPAQRRGWEGTAEVLLQIAADGNVTGITLGKSSGHAILDEEALNMVRRASPLPAAPPDLRGRALVVTVPIVFRLQNS